MQEHPLYPDTVQKCINDDSDLFIESIPLYETWEPTGDYEVINPVTGNIIESSDDRNL